MKRITRLRRADSFLGLHFDFHAGADCKEVGKTISRGQIERLVDAVRPDYLQCDCKGHPGFSSYPTKVGNRAPGFVRDPLRIWRDVTAQRGVALFMHYSGVWDTQAIKKHPSWARIDEMGKRDANNTSVFGPYVDKLLIPQLRELANEYDVDGVWIDGDCWATALDFGKNVIAAFRETRGIRKIPRKASDPHFMEFLDFCREGFRRYLRRYVDEIHRTHPKFQIASNWAFTSFMPEPVSANVDFLSGDYSSMDAVNSARYEGRCLARQGKPWDLMAWSFCAKWDDGMKNGGWCTKSSVQLQREAAVVLALGGGFQAYFQQKRDASINEWQLKLMGDVAKFCRERQTFCHGAKSVPQIALIYAGSASYRAMEKPFNPWGATRPLAGLLTCLLEAQNSVDILMEHHLDERLAEYPLVVLPEYRFLSQAVCKKLVEYVRAGGKLLIVGPSSAASFRRELGVKFKGKTSDKTCFLEHDDYLASMKAVHQTVLVSGGAKAFGKFYLSREKSGEAWAAGSIAKLGKGEIGAVYIDVGKRYREAKTVVARDFMNAMVRRMFPRPMVEVSGSRNVDVAVNRIGGKLALNLVNTAGPHDSAETYTFDEIPEVGPLRVLIRSKSKPRRIVVEPGERAISYRYKSGEVEMKLDKVAIHDVIVVE